MAKSYRALLRGRLLVAGLTLGLVVVMVGVIMDLLLTSRRTTIAKPTQKLIAPLNPQLDLSVIETLENYELVTFEDAREGVRVARQADGAAQSLIEVGEVANERDSFSDLGPIENPQSPEDLEPENPDASDPTDPASANPETTTPDPTPPPTDPNVITPGGGI